MRWKPVAPLAGAWIEISDSWNIYMRNSVAPLAGAWIEIAITGWIVGNRYLSLPSRERGLKYMESEVHPLQQGRSPRGSVD